MEPALQKLQKKIRLLKVEKEKLECICKDLQATQSELEHALGDANMKVLEAEMSSMELEQVLRAYTDAMWVLREDGIVVRVNEAMLLFLDKSEDEEDGVVGHRWSDLLDPPTREKCLDFFPVAGEQTGRRREFDLARENSAGETEHYIVTTASLVTLDGSSGIVAQFKNITLRKQAAEALAEANAKLERMARLDGLTQVANRRAFDESLAREWARLAREKAPLALVLCDIDYFKKYNDSYGHQAGDDCLTRVARTLERNAARPADLAARYGGEEFALLLPNTDAAGARLVAERARRSVLLLAIEHKASDVCEVVSLSLGVACRIPKSNASPEALIASADAALYRAKEGGRNRVVLEEEENSPLLSPSVNQKAS